MFTGAILPELVMISASRQSASAWDSRATPFASRFRSREAASAIWSAKWELALPVIMIIGLFGGFGTLTEAAALTAFCAFVVEVFIYRDLKLTRDYREVFVECATIVGGILLILGVALGFTNYLIDAEVPARLIDWVQTHVQSKYLFLLLLNVALLVVGALMDIFAAILVVVPLIKPLAAAYRIDPVQMGVIFIANLELGYLHPPVGINLFLVGLPLQEADGHHHLGHAPVPVHPDGNGPADHLRPLAHHRPAALVRQVGPLQGGIAPPAQEWPTAQAIPRLSTAVPHSLFPPRSCGGRSSVASYNVIREEQYDGAQCRNQNAM